MSVDGITPSCQFKQRVDQGQHLRHEIQNAKGCEYEYVVATISTKDHLINVRLDDQLVCSLEYRMPVEYRRY